MISFWISVVPPKIQHDRSRWYVRNTCTAGHDQLMQPTFVESPHDAGFARLLAGCGGPTLERVG